MHTDKKLKHLEFIQNVITRMNTNSFLIKGWATTIVSALFALAAKDTNIKFALISYFAIPVFWILDGYYLSRERRFRSLYNRVAAIDDATTATDFSMDISGFNDSRNLWIYGIFSRTLNIFYFTLLGITGIVMYFLNIRN